MLTKPGVCIAEDKKTPLAPCYWFGPSGVTQGVVVVPGKRPSMMITVCTHVVPTQPDSFLRAPDVHCHVRCNLLLFLYR